MDKEMMAALEADGEKLRQLTGEDHGPMTVEVACEACGGEGRKYSGHPNDPDPTDHGPCKWCNGTGAEVIETQPVEMADLDDYATYRGKCKEMSEALVASDPSLTLVRGHYFCPFWGEQPHWWVKRPDGTIIDPTKAQFPSKGIGEYVEFTGVIPCSNCGKEIKEEDADIEGRYAFCSYECHGKFVGVF